MSVPFLVDTHCHLNSEALADEAGEAVARALEAGVERMVVVGYDMTSSEEAVALAERLAPVYAAVAVHPHDARNYDARAEARLRELAAHPCVVAIGEIGLDYHYDFSPVEEQAAAMQAQLRLAEEAGLPVIIHCREAYRDVLDALERAEGARANGVVMHCWAGEPAEAKRALALGCHLGIGGVVTFKNAEAVRTAARAAPADRLLVETDAPYLAPVPHRGKRNEPAYTRLVAEKLAEVRGEPLEAVAAQTTRNALALFRRMG